MNVSIIYRMFQDSESSGKYRFGGKKPINGDKRRRCEEYGLKRSNYVRRKQTKVRYDTWRRQEMPTEEDERGAKVTPCLMTVKSTLHKLPWRQIWRPWCSLCCVKCKCQVLRLYARRRRCHYSQR